MTRATAFLLACAISASAADTPPDKSAVPCTMNAADCGVTAAEMKQAKKLYDRGNKLKLAGKVDEALDEFEQASKIVPRNAEFATAREMARQALVYDHIERGNQLMLRDQRIQAMAEFNAAAVLDPENTFAQSRIRDAVPLAPRLTAGLMRVERSTEVRLEPKRGRHDFHLRTDLRQVYEQVMSAYGINVEFDNSTPGMRVRFDLGDADFPAALASVERATKTFTVPVDEHKVMVMADTQDNHNRFERSSMQTFYVTNANSPAELNEYVNTLRTVFDIQRLSISASNSAIIVRGPQRLVDLASQFIEQTQQGPPQVMLEVKVYEVSHSGLKSLGISLPLQFQMFNLSSAAIAAALGAGGADLINQLISSGAINQANNQAIQALLAQLKNQQGSILNTPFATFGGGMTRFAVVIPPLTANFGLNSTDLRSLEHLTVRASQNDAATVRIGTRYPILNATFAPIFNSAALTQVLGNNSFIAPFPSFTYQDLGLTLKATPSIHTGNDITLKIELQIQGLGAQSFNGIPVLTNRQYNGTITVLDGESAVVAGMISQQDSASLSGVPGFSYVPGAGYAGSTKTNQINESELLVTITPHIISSPTSLSSATYVLRQ